MDVMSNEQHLMYPFLAALVSDLIQRGKASFHIDGFALDLA